MVIFSFLRGHPRMALGSLASPICWFRRRGAASQSSISPPRADGAERGLDVAGGTHRLFGAAAPSHGFGLPAQPGRLPPLSPCQDRGIEPAFEPCYHWCVLQERGEVWCAQGTSVSSAGRWRCSSSVRQRCLCPSSSPPS